ncbi:MAG: AEC family transporter [Thermofilaceae archaeon]
MGAIYAALAKPDERVVGELSRVVLAILLPLLLFTSVYGAGNTGEGLARMGVAVLLVALVSLASSYALTRDRELMLLSTYVNAGYIPIPLARALWGAEALPLVSFYILFNASIGYLSAPLLLKGRLREGLRELSRFPPLYAIALGLLLSLAEVIIPSPVLEAVSAVGNAAPYIALLTLGMRMVKLRPSHVGDAVKVSIVRFIIAPATLWALAPLIFEVGSLPYKVALLESMMPPAVTAGILCSVYGSNPERGAVIVLLLTSICFAILPIALRFIVEA